MLNVEMLSTGDEVLHGQIVDTNAAWLADFFFNQGLPLSRRNTVGDNLDALVAILRERSEHADVLIVNGGLGPTSDDLSALAAATAKGEGLVLHDAWLAEMERFFHERGRVMAPSNRKQAELPASAAHTHQHAERKGLAALSLPAQQRWRRSLNSGQGHQACGWIFDADTVFDTIGLLEWARLAPVGRVKGVMRIKEGLVRINRQGDDLHIETQNVAPPDSRIELISDRETDWNTLQTALLKLRLAEDA